MKWKIAQLCVNTLLSLPFTFPCVVYKAKCMVMSFACVLFLYFFFYVATIWHLAQWGFCRGGKGEEKEVGKTDTRVIGESFISQNKLLELQHIKWLVLRQKGDSLPLAGWECQLRSALALSATSASLCLNSQDESLKI